MTPDPRAGGTGAEPARFLAHPWHGIGPGDRAPAAVTVYVELLPTDTVKYEVDKASGHLRLDRPQRYSSLCPVPYGFIPQTLCGDRVAALATARTGRRDLVGDGDPLDACVLAERPLAHAGILLTARPVGGFRMLDSEAVDDKVIAVLEGDAVFGDIEDIAACPPAMIDRLRHYFLTYKDMPSADRGRVVLADVYGAAAAHDVIRQALADYRRGFERVGEVAPRVLRSTGAESTEAT